MAAPAMRMWILLLVIALSSACLLVLDLGRFRLAGSGGR